jgi:hypothetical protein
MPYRPSRLPLLILGVCNVALAQPNWQVRVDSVPGGIQDMIWSGDRALAVDQGGSILSSPDGANWTVQDSGGALWHSIVRSGTGRFLASSIDGSWALSEDGLSWTRHGTGNPGIFAAAAIGNKLIASEAETGNLFSSTDDTTWVRVGADSQSNIGGMNQIGGLASNGNIVVGAGHQTLMDGDRTLGGGLAAVSPDGEAWRFRPVDQFPVGDRVRWAKERFFTLGHGVLASSPDGAAWTALDIPDDDFPFDLTWTGNQFVLVGGLGLIRVSGDGAHWQTIRYLRDSLVWFNRAIWTGSRLVLAGTHSIAGKECRYIATLDNDNLAIRNAPSPEARMTWRKEGDRLTARLPGGPRPGRVRLFDLRGYLRRDIPILPGSAQVELPLAGLGRGKYGLRVEGDPAHNPALFSAPFLITR